MKKIQILLLFTILSSLAHTQNPLNSIVGFSSGILYSDITSWDEVITDANSGKYGYYLSIGYQQRVWKYLHLKSRGNYFSKKPLEVFVFGSNPDIGIGALHIFGEIPTSKQSDDFEPKTYKILNNFKYLGIDIMPTVSIKGKIIFDVGIGFFYRRLVNPEEVIVKREDLPVFDFFFEPPFSVTGEVLYGKNEWGWTSSTSILLPINNKISIGLEGNFYHSFRGMHDDPYPAVLGNPKWLVINGGLSVQYSFRKREK